MAVGANAVVERAVLEGLSTVIEGVHVVPGLVTAEQHAAAVVVQLMLAITDEDSHRSHFFARGSEPGALRSLSAAAAGGRPLREIVAALEPRRYELADPRVAFNVNTAEDLAEAERWLLT